MPNFRIVAGVADAGLAGANDPGYSSIKAEVEGYVVPNAVRDDYLDLIRRFRLRPIRTEDEYDLAINLLKDLVSRSVQSKLSPGEHDHSQALTQFVTAYEAVHYAIAPVLKTPLARLKYIMKESGMSTVELGELLVAARGRRHSSSTASAS